MASKKITPRRVIRKAENAADKAGKLTQRAVSKATHTASRAARKARKGFMDAIDW